MNKTILKNIVHTALILIAAFFAALAIQNLLSAPRLVPAVFVLAVFLISLLTNGYIYGLLSALVSVLAVNFAFTFPFFEFNFTIQENAVSALIMIAVTAITCALTTKIKQHDALKAENEKEKMRANLLRAISHDLRTPLTAIYGSASTIADNYAVLKDEDKINMLIGIKEDSQWLIRMVENLLSVTRFDSPNVKLIKTSVVLEELIDSVLSKFHKRYPHVNVGLQIPKDFIAVSADPILIEQVLINLLENAVIHAKGMTKVNLNVFVLGSKAIFEVKDDGEGIAPEKFKTLFTTFSGASGDGEGKTHSMGIGLSVCATIIKAHNGALSAENCSEGGAVFRFSLDLEEEI
ncbi:MAG: PAS domain-containing sensor histidine kinase [Clostridia bacterium]|nr:PAS domain-containing sensor histidine kinase [Clostridia bacterium]